MMDVDRKRSKGGFLNLFDWHGKKSRKKLFSYEAEQLEYPKPRSQNVGSFNKPELHMTEPDDTQTNSSNKASSEYNCASSVTSDDGQGARAPSVVAKLMGLDSLPTQCNSENRFPTALDPYSLSARSHYVRNAHDLWSGSESLEYVNLPWNCAEPRIIGMQARPIEKFQTEILPPKSAKSIPVTHNRLLSPIRNPSFVPTKNPAYIMEAASRIIEPSPRAISKVRVSSVGSSPIPQRIRDLKEKLESAHKASKPERHVSQQKASKCQTTDGGSSHARNARENQRDKRKCAPPSSGRSILDDSMNKGKLSCTTFTAQAKTVAQRREGSSLSSNNRASAKKKEKTGATRPVVHRIQPDASRNASKGSGGNTIKPVLRQNNQKQNCKDILGPNCSALNLQNRKCVNGVVSKAFVDSETSLPSKKIGTSLNHNEKERPLLRRKTLLKDRNALNKNGQGAVPDYKRNGMSNGNLKLDGDKQKKDMDVISFTFSSTIKGLSSESRMMPIEMETNGGSCIRNQNFTSRFSLMDSDDLSSILEQKLRELTNKIEASAGTPIQEGAPESVTSYSQDTPLHQSPEKDARESLYEPGKKSFDNQGRILNTKYQIVEHKDMDFNVIELLDQGMGTVALELDSLSNGSCSNYANNSNEDQKSFSWDSTNESQRTQDEMEMSESASSVSMGTYSVVEFKQPSNWELEYIRSILNNGKLLVKEFTLGEAQKIIGPPTLFDQLENHSIRTDNEEEDLRLARRALFDCVSECLELRCEQLATGVFKTVGKHTTLLGKKELLAQDVYRDIASWCENTGELMVDELVDKDMSNGKGRWLDYDREAFEQGTEVEKWIVTCLVDEVVSDLSKF